jgi:phage shock protein A
MQARAAAVEELTAAGALEDFTATGDDIDRQLAAISAGTQVDDDLARLKAELGAGAEPAALEAGGEKTEAEK